MSPRAIFVRILTALHAALGRWLVEADVPVVKLKRTSWFDVEPGTLASSGDPDEEVGERRRRNTFRIGH